MTVPTVNVKMAANSTKHGRYAKKMVLMTPKIHRRKRQIIDLLEGHKFPFGEIDMIAVELLARNLTKIDMVDTYLAEHGLWDEKGVPRAILSYYHNASTLAVNLCDKLGMTPTSRVKMGMQLSAGERDFAAAIQAERNK